MANEKILNTRVQLKYDTLANWNASTFIPKKGEMCIATVDTAQKDAKGNIITVPTLLIKVGSGAEGATFSTLPFVSAPAADVYDWAKKDEASFVKEFLSMKNGDQTMQALLDGVFATDSELSTAIAGIQGQIDTLAGKVSVAEGKITALEGKVDVAKVSEAISTAVAGEAARADAAEKKVLEDAKAYTDEVKDALLGTEELVGTYDTLKEIGAWIANSGVDATELSGAIAAEAKAREDADKAINDTIATLATKEELAAEKKAREDADTAINETIAEVKATAEAAQTADEVSDAIDAKIEVLDLANTYQAKGEYATAAQGALADTALQAADITAGPTYGVGENDNGSAGMDILVKGSSAASLVMTAAKDGGLKIDNQASGASHQVIGAIALTDEAKASLEKADSALQEITTTANGGLKVTNKNQIDIDDSLVFVFDCGSATENIG